jgi:hypothetical protein
VNTIHLTDTELALTRHGMTAYLRTFGHNEADTVELIKAVLNKLSQAESDSEDAIFIG